MNLKNLPIKFLALIAKELCYIDLIALGLAYLPFKHQLEIYDSSLYDEKLLVMNRLKQKFKNTNIDVEKFIECLIQDKAVISGSFILQCVYDVEWIPSDIDIYYAYTEDNIKMCLDYDKNIECYPSCKTVQKYLIDKGWSSFGDPTTLEYAEDCLISKKLSSNRKIYLQEEKICGHFSCIRKDICNGHPLSIVDKFDYCDNIQMCKFSNCCLCEYKKNSKFKNFCENCDRFTIDLVCVNQNSFGTILNDKIDLLNNITKKAKVEYIQIKFGKSIIELNLIEKFINEVFDIDLCKNYFDGTNIKFKFIDHLFKRRSGYSLNLNVKQYFEKRNSNSIIGIDIESPDKYNGINPEAESIKITDDVFTTYMKNSLQKRIKKYTKRNFFIKPKKYFILMTLLLARHKNPDNVFYKFVFPLDIFKIIIKMCDLFF